MAYLILKERRLSVLFIKLKLLCLVGLTLSCTPSTDSHRYERL